MVVDERVSGRLRDARECVANLLNDLLSVRALTCCHRLNVSILATNRPARHQAPL